MVGVITSALRRGAPTCINRIGGRPLSRPSALIRKLPFIQHLHRRNLHEDASESEHASTSAEPESEPGSESWPEPEQYETPSSSPPLPPPNTISPSDLFRHSFKYPMATLSADFNYKNVGKDVTVHGFLRKRKDVTKNLSFCQIDNGAAKVQIVSSWQRIDSLQERAHRDLKAIPPWSAVSVTGTLAASDGPAHARTHSAVRESQSWDLKLRYIRCLNPFPRDIIVSKDAVWPAKSRNLQIRFDPLLRDRLRFRNRLVSVLRKDLESRGFSEVETPLLFKSTPEGAREFLVPTRRQGYAYALPQSPQQYKQILMTTGITKYYQFAKCFRDEDHRADRQPEFTQLDLEMAFADGQDVMKHVEKTIHSIFEMLRNLYIPSDVNGIRHPVWRGYQDERQIPKADKLREQENLIGDTPTYQRLKMYFPKMSYQYCMENMGTDKPDIRMKMPDVSNITPVTELLSSDFVKMITNLEDPIIEACKFRLRGSASENMSFIQEFFDALGKSPQKLGPDSSPGVFVFDPSKPLQGLSALGHESAEKITNLTSGFWAQCEDGDVIVMHARKREPFQGGSTELGRIRKLVYDKATASGLLPKDDKFRFLWVVDFPLFSPNGEDPGQGGAAGFSSTHHPFTSPATEEDFDLLATDPLKAKGYHYDLVVNGVEVGGGSRRIHVAEVQEYIMRDILKMTEEGISEFSHLIDALKAGCPPHAGFAFGFDRLVSVLCDVPSVRDVIPFPKNNKGADQLVGSPSKTTAAQRKTYHLFSEES